MNTSEQKETFHRETYEPLKLDYNQRKKLENIKHVKNNKTTDRLVCFKKGDRFKVAIKMKI